MTGTTPTVAAQVPDGPSAWSAADDAPDFGIPLPAAALARAWSPDRAVIAGTVDTGDRGVRRATVTSVSPR
jgi:hypothetical protein